jgi:4Fe-4S dicluster domain
MCPSYLGTNEEKYSTRGRARPLFEMMRGDVLTDGFADAAVEVALDLCLACKGCKHDCPVETDMATYKAEFRARHYESKWRPRAAYSMEQIARWARYASYAPGLANLAMSAPGLSGLAKRIGGIAEQRRMPRFTNEAYRAWRRRHPARNGGERVARYVQQLLPAGYGDRGDAPARRAGISGRYSRRAALLRAPALRLGLGRPGESAVAEYFGSDGGGHSQRRPGDRPRAGLRVRVPRRIAKPVSRRCAGAGAVEADALSDRVFKGPGSLARSSGFARAPSCSVSLPSPFGARQEGRVGAHQGAARAISGLAARMLRHGRRLRLRGGQIRLSRTIAEHGLLPDIANTPKDTIIIANGFSCREMIEQLSGRPTTHLAQYLASAGS